MFLFQGFDLITRIVGWDVKWFYLEQRFEREGRPIATAYARALVRGAEGSIPTDRIIAALGFRISSPELPEEVRRMGE